MQILKDSRILKMRREGTKNYYYFNMDMSTLQDLITMLEHTKYIMVELPDRSGEDD